MPDKEAAKLVQEKADQMIKEMDSIGGIIECQITGMPVGIGETVFDKLDADRVGQIVNIVGGELFGQVFMTDTNREHIDEILRQQACDYRLFTVVDGRVIS